MHPDTAHAIATIRLEERHREAAEQRLLRRRRNPRGRRGLGDRLASRWRRRTSCSQVAPAS